MEYSHDRNVTAEQFIDVLKRSTLAERRPVDDYARICAMLEHADIIATAWEGDQLVGISRSVTDFSYCCYLSDLAVDVAYQKRGIGNAVDRTHPIAFAAKMQTDSSLRAESSVLLSIHWIPPAPVGMDSRLKLRSRSP